MTTFIVTKVRKELSRDTSHEHIEGVCTDDGTHYTRQQVVDSINAGNTWRTSAGGYEATIKVVKYCPNSYCLEAPYIETNPDSTTMDNLDNLPRC